MLQTRIHRFTVTHAIVALVALFAVVDGVRAQGQLDYRQRQTFDLADHNLLQVEGNLERVSQQVASATARDAPQAQANVDALGKYLKQANDQIVKLPAENEDVKGLAKRAADAAAAIEKLQAALNARVSGTQGAVNAETAAFEADVDKLAEWGKAFSDAPNLFHRAPDDALLLVSNMANVESEWKAIQTRNATLLDQQNHDPDARKIQAAANFFDRSFPSFKQHVAQLSKELPGQTDQAFADAQMWMDRAVAEQNPLLIINGVSQQMQQIERNVALMKGIDAATGSTGGDAYEKRMNELKTKSAQAHVALRESMIQANEGPQPQYAGDDVTSLREQVKAAWMKANPKSEVLAIVFNTPGWNRVTRWQWRLHSGATGDIHSGTWEKVDYDVIQPKVVVGFDERLAVVYPVDIYKDHMRGGELAIKPWEVAAEPDVRSLMLRERVKR